MPKIEKPQPPSPEEQAQQLADDIIKKSGPSVSLKDINRKNYPEVSREVLKKVKDIIRRERKHQAEREKKKRALGGGEVEAAVEPAEDFNLDVEPVAGLEEEVERAEEEVPEWDLEVEEPVMEELPSDEELEFTEPVWAEEEILEKKSFIQGFKKRFGDFFRKHFKGELVEKVEKKEKDELKDVVDTMKTFGVVTLSALASVGGFKSVVDLPRWFFQKYYTKKEQNKIIRVLEMRTAIEADEEELKKEFEENKERFPEAFKELDIRTFEQYKEHGRESLLIYEKKARLKEKVDQSKYLTPERKQELLTKLNSIVDSYAERNQELDKAAGEETAKFLSDYIETRVKGTTALKESLNTLLTASGLYVFRGLTYGAISVIERYKRIAKEKRIEGEKWGALERFRNVFIDGFKETYQGITFQTEGGKRVKAMSFVKASGTIMRVLGIGGMALSEFSSGDFGEHIDKMLDVWEKTQAQVGGVSGAVEFTKTGFGERLNSLEQMFQKTTGFITGEAPPEAPTAAPEAAPAAAGTVKESIPQPPSEEVTPEKLSENFAAQHALLKESGADIKIEGGRTMVEYDIGEGADFKNLDQALRRVVVDLLPVEADEQFSALEAARAENILANLRELSLGHNVAGERAADWQEILKFDEKSGSFVITDYAKFQENAGRLVEYANSSITEGSDALAYVDNTSQNQWQEMMDQKVQAAGEIEVADFSKDTQVTAAEARVFKQSVEHLGLEGVKDVQFLGEEDTGRFIFGGSEVTVRDGLITDYGDVHFSEPVPLNNLEMTENALTTYVNIEAGTNEITEMSVGQNLIAADGYIEPKVGIFNVDYKSPEEIIDYESMNFEFDSLSPAERAAYLEEHALVKGYTDAIKKPLDSWPEGLRYAGEDAVRKHVETAGSALIADSRALDALKLHGYSESTLAKTLRQSIGQAKEALRRFKVLKE